jgi:hypothetical protein
MGVSAAQINVEALAISGWHDDVVNSSLRPSMDSSRMESDQKANDIRPRGEQKVSRKWARSDLLALGQLHPRTEMARVKHREALLSGRAPTVRPQVQSTSPDPHAPKVRFTSPFPARCVFGRPSVGRARAREWPRGLAPSGYAAAHAPPLPP